jgi:hypothetical protein
MRKERVIALGFLVVSFFAFLSLSTPRTLSNVAPIPEDVFINQKISFIKSSTTLTSFYEFATYVVLGEVTNTSCYELRKGDINTAATVKIDMILKGSIQTQTMTIHYSGGTVGNSTSGVLYNWGEQDYMLPTFFFLYEGRRIFAFVDSDFEILVYIDEPSQYNYY